MDDRDKSVMGRFVDRILLWPTGCWEWVGSMTPGGYGTFWKDGGTRLAHRVAYELFVGPIPKGLHIDHLCRNSACVNPAHLEPVTPKLNNNRGVSFTARNARKTHCPQGHEYTKENTLWIRGGRHRRCKTCYYARSREKYAQRRAAGFPGYRVISWREFKSTLPTSGHDGECQ